MSPEQTWTKEDADGSALKCLEALRKNNFSGNYFSNCNEALGHLLGTIPPDASVGFGDSLTIQQIGLPRVLHRREQKLFSPFWHEDLRLRPLQVGSAKTLVCESST